MDQSSTYQKVFEDAVKKGDSLGLQKVLENWSAKVNVNFFDREGQTALHNSILEGNLESVKLLVKFGADIRLANRDGWSPYHIAAFSGHRDIVLYLVNAYQR